MGKLSSNTLFHFTPKYEYLKGILSNGYHPRYCSEKFLPGKDIKALKEFAVPMVCFCDIPLSQISGHIQFYGSYGLGMSKEWILKNKIVPVHYAYDNSPNILARAESLTEFNELTELIDKAVEDFDKKLEYTKLSSEAKLLFNLTYESFYFKELEGYTLDKKGRKVFKKFYDEKEWRFIPTPQQVCGTDVLPYLEGDIEKQKAANNELLAEHFPLPLEPKDIKYILVENENEIKPMMALIDQIFGKYPQDDVYVLKSRIIDSARIIEDL